jgi:hypothetical protein
VIATSPFVGKTMKKLQHLSAVVVLTLLLSISTFAGDGIILTWRTDPPPPPPPASAMTTNNEVEAEGVIHTGRSESVDPVTEVALGLLQSVLALF